MAMPVPMAMSVRMSVRVSVNIVRMYVVGMLLMHIVRMPGMIVVGMDVVAMNVVCVRVMHIMGVLCMDVVSVLCVPYVLIMDVVGVLVVLMFEMNIVSMFIMGVNVVSMDVVSFVRRRRATKQMATCPIDQVAGGWVVSKMRTHGQVSTGVSVMFESSAVTCMILRSGLTSILREYSRRTLLVVS